MGADDLRGQAMETVVIRMVWLDDHGREHLTVATTSMELDMLRAKAGAMRQSMALYYYSLGWELLDVQVEVLDRRGLIDRRRRTRTSANESRNFPDGTDLVPLFPAEEQPERRSLGRVIMSHFGRKS